MRRMKAVLVAAAVLGVAAGGVMSAEGLLGRNEAKAELGVAKSAEDAEADLEAGPASVPAVPVEAVTENETIRLPGSLAADEEAEVGVNVAAPVKAVHVERGSIVGAGDVLVELDPTDMQNMLAEGEAAVEELRVRLGLEKDDSVFAPENQPEVQSAKAALDLATVSRDRVAGMVREGIASKEMLDQAETEYRSAEQRYQQALFQVRQLYQSYLTAKTRLKSLNKAVSDTIIRAPFSGWIKQRQASVGERVAPGNEGIVATVVKIDPLRLVLTVPQQYAAQVSTGQKVVFRVEGFPDRVFEGEVRYVAPALDANSRSLTVEALVPNADRTLRPGLFATAELALPTTATKLFVPATAVLRQGEVAVLYVVQDGVARQRIASLGETRGDRVEVLTGLQPGDVVVAAPDKVSDGAKVVAQLN
jgi:membrane fusion protein (multidrug efflux system)